MTGVVPRFGAGPVTYEVVEAITGGQVVEARAGGKIGVAGAGSATVLGVATRNAAPATANTGTTATGFPVTDLSHQYVTPYVAVGKEGEWDLVYAADAAFGELLQAGANGTVTPLGAGAATLAIGRCTEPGGVVVATKNTGLVKLSV